MVCIFNYFILAQKRRHNKIIEEFKSESEGKRKKGMVYTVLYLKVSLGIPLYIFFLQFQNKIGSPIARALLIMTFK
jgi:hypothetical protein